MFKDKKGNSVDRDGGRSVDEIVDFMRETTFGKRLKGVVELDAGKCMETGARVCPDPTDKNPYHANIFIDEDELIGNLQALQLADMSSVVFVDEEVRWTSPS